MTKQEARAYYREKRASLSVVSYAELQNQLLTHFKNIPFSSLQWVHSYLPMPSSNEIDTAPFISHLSFLFPGLNICVPVTPKGSDSIINALWEKNAVFVPNRFGIPEPTSITEIDPKQIDLVIVPLLAFDKAGYRVGYGKGYYDRFLVKCKEEATIIGLSFFPPLPCITDRQQFDIPLDLCITPEQIYEFG